MFLAALCLAAGLSACTQERRVFLYQLNRAGKIEQKSLERTLWENALPEGQELKSSRILDGDFASYHVIQVRTQEKPHRHDFHDLAVFVQSGSGILFSGKDSTAVSEGSMVFIPHGTAHYFVNTGPVPAVAVAVFSPPFNGDDVIPVENLEKSVLP